MRKFVISAVATIFLASSCLPAPATEPPATVDLDATAAVFVQQTLLAIPTITTAPTNTPVVINETFTSTAPAETATPITTGTVEQNMSSVPATGTLATTVGTNSQVTTNTATSTVTFTPTAGVAGEATTTLHPRFYGTLPPNLPFNSIELINRSKAEAYISLQVTTPDGYTTILEYPVNGSMSVKAPVGKYKYVAWVGGNKLIGSFVLGRNNQLRITIYKNRIEIKN